MNSNCEEDFENDEDEEDDDNNDDDENDNKDIDGSTAMGLDDSRKWLPIVYLRNAHLADSSNQEEEEREEQR